MVAWINLSICIDELIQSHHSQSIQSHLGQRIILQLVVSSRLVLDENAAINSIHRTYFHRRGESLNFTRLEMFRSILRTQSRCQDFHPGGGGTKFSPKFLKWKMGSFERIVAQIRGVFNFGGRFGGPGLAPGSRPPAQKYVATLLPVHPLPPWLRH